MDNQESKKEKGLKSINAYAQYSSLGIQMGVIIFFGVVAGEKLDQKFPISKFPIFTIICSLVAVGLSLYLALKGVIKIQNKNNESK